MGTLGLNASTTYSQETKLSLRLENVSIKELFNEIGKKSEFSFWYSNKELNDKDKITISIKNQTIDKILVLALKNQNLAYEIKDKVVVIYKPSEKINEEKAAQQLTVKGTVTDASSNEPLPGVSIVVEGTTMGTVTDLDGHYSINIPSQSSILVFSYVGFVSERITLEDRTIINLSMVPDIKALDEVVIVAYGNTTQRKSTGALQTVQAKDLQSLPVSQFTQKLQGKFAGVRINQGTGRPGEGINVQVRGAASLSTSSSPLYVVDGFPISGDISSINPDEIEAITVLKDAASTSLYGSRAAFGVVLVTTKSAKSGKTEVNVNAYTGVQNVPQKGRPDMMNGREWAQFKKESYEDLGQAVPAAFQNPEQYGEGYNWYDAMLRTGYISDYSISINTSKDNFSSSIVAGFFDQKGVLLNSNYKRYTIRANNLYRINERLKTGFNIAPTYSTGNSPSSDGQFFGSGGLLLNAALTPPIVSYKNADGSYPISVTTPGVTTFPTPNWVRSIGDITNRSNVSRLLSNAYIEFEPVKDLKLKSSINTDLGQSLQHWFQPSTAGRGFASEPSALNANLSETNYKYWTWLSENTVTYAKKVNEHSFDVLGGYTVQKFRSDWSNISGYNFADNRVQTIDAALVKNNSRMDIQEWSMLSYIGRLNYDYRGKYFLGASIRRDGSSRFGANSKWGNFPAVSAGWVVTEESFAKNLNWLSFLKIRGSYGLTGNNNIGNYTQYNNVSNSNAVFNNTTASGIAITSLGNIDLGWENTKDLDLGVDLTFFGGRISFNYDYYNKVTDNLLYRLDVPNESGFSSFMGNVGKVQFWGHEFNINSNNFVGEFNWNTNFNISFSDNKVKALSAVSDTLYGGTGVVSTITRVGGRIGQFYGLIQDGVYVGQTDFEESPKLVDSQVGTIKFRDVNKDGKITNGNSGGDKTEIGNPFPKFYFGFTNNFSYKNIDLSIVTTGSYGNKIAAAMEQGYTNLDGVFNVLRDVKDRWRSEENPGSGKYGKTTGSTSHDRDDFHTRYVNDGSYLAIKNITLGYTVPARYLKFVNGLRIYASVQQAYVFTKYKYGNPEVGIDFNGNAPASTAQGIDFSAYPVPRTFTFGINVKLK